MKTFKQHLKEARILPRDIAIQHGGYAQSSRFPVAKTGEHVDFYEPRTGEKKYGKVKFSSKDEIHIEHEGKLHKMKIYNEDAANFGELVEGTFGKTNHPTQGEVKIYIPSKEEAEESSGGSVEGNFKTKHEETWHENAKARGYKINKNMTRPSGNVDPGYHIARDSNGNHRGEYDVKKSGGFLK